MADRHIVQDPGFRKHLDKLTRRQPLLREQVEGLLGRIARDPTPHGAKIPGQGGAPVFKVRLPLGTKGKQSGARLIYYRDEERVVALFLYSKGDVTDIPVKEIREALAPYLDPAIGARVGGGDAGGGGSF